MSDPSLLVTNPTRRDPVLAPDGRHIYYVLFPTPNLDAPIDWDVVGPRYRDEVLATLEQRGYVGFGDGIEVEGVTTPADWRPAAWSAARRSRPRTRSSRPARSGPANLAGVENVVFAGSGTQPGVGVPMVLLSGRLAAERILGPDRELPQPRLAELIEPPASSQPACRNA